MNTEASPQSGANTFRTGVTYFTRSAVDHEHVITVKVARRTAKTIKTETGKTLRIGVLNGIEFVRPWGNYSMAPHVWADRVAQ